MSFSASVFLWGIDGYELDEVTEEAVGMIAPVVLGYIVPPGPVEYLDKVSHSRSLESGKRLTAYRYNVVPILVGIAPLRYHLEQAPTFPATGSPLMYLDPLSASLRLVVRGSVLSHSSTSNQGGASVACAVTCIS